MWYNYKAINKDAQEKLPGMQRELPSIEFHDKGAKLIGVLNIQWSPVIKVTRGQKCNRKVSMSTFVSQSKASDWGPLVYEAVGDFKGVGGCLECLSDLHHYPQLQYPTPIKGDDFVQIKSFPSKGSTCTCTCQFFNHIQSYSIPHSPHVALWCVHQFRVDHILWLGAGVKQAGARVDVDILTCRDLHAQEIPNEFER